LERENSSTKKIKNENEAELYAVRQLADGKGSGGRGRVVAKSYDGEKAWSYIIDHILSGIHYQFMITLGILKPYDLSSVETRNAKRKKNRSGALNGPISP
jgi:hypothetical protein